MYSKMRASGVFAAIVAGATLLSACGASGGADASSGTILVGTSVGLTGPSAAGCKPTGDGVGAWLKQVNTQGGVNGHKFKQVVKDDATDPTRTVANVRGLAADKVVAIVGGCGTAAAVAAAPVLNAMKVPFIAPVAAGDVLYTPVQPYVFSIYPAYNLQLAALTTEAITGGDVHSVALVATERPGWEKVEADVKAATAKGGATYLGTQSSALGTTDFTAQAVKIAHEKPDLLVSHMGIAEASRMLKALDAQGFLPKKMVVDTAQTDQAFVESGGYLVAGRIRMVSIVPLAQSAAAKPCVDALNAAGVTVSSFALQGCAQAQVFTTAAEKAGKDVTRESVRKALESFDNQGGTILPPLSFSPQNHLGLDKLYEFGIEGKQLVDTGKTVQLNG